MVVQEVHVKCKVTVKLTQEMDRQGQHDAAFLV